MYNPHTYDHVTDLQKKHRGNSLEKGIGFPLPSLSNDAETTK